MSGTSESMVASPPRARLISGNRNYSSWSLRAWLALRKAGVDPKIEVLPLDTPEFERRIGSLSPTRCVPVLWLNDECVWDSLAINETVNERFAADRLWPADSTLRTLARSMACEMHSGFGALRRALPMNCKAHQRRVEIDAAVRQDIDRIAQLWHQARSSSKSDSWLFETVGIVDCMFAPVALRFSAYALDLPVDTQRYVEHWLADDDLQQWIADAKREDWRIEHEEVGVASP